MTNLKKNKWLIPFRGRNMSSASNVNFLWNEDNIYIMDNHLLAAWCWAQELKKNHNFGIIHIDAHYDLNRLHDKNGKELKPFKEISLHEYLGLEEKSYSTFYKAIQWDNYFTLFLDQFSCDVYKLVIAAHKTDLKNINESNRMIDEEWPVEKLLKYLDTEFSEEDNDVIIPQKWIINLDIDYFFCEIGERKGIQLLSNEYITEFACILKNALQRNRIIGLTIALSPECCGGWKNAESICSIITDKIGLNFKLE